MALVRIEDSDSWLAEYNACEKLFLEIMEIVEQFTPRNKNPKSPDVNVTLSANVRIRLRQYSREVQELKNKVDNALKSKTITAEEAERRIRQIETLQSRDVKLQRLQTMTSNFAFPRSKLFTSNTSAFTDGGATSSAANNDDDDDDKPLDTQLSFADLKAKRKQILEEQNKGLEELSKVIARQKQMSTTFNNEINHHNEIIDVLCSQVDHTDEALINRIQSIQAIDSKNRTCGYWIVIIFLFVCIIVVSFLPL